MQDENDKNLRLCIFFFLDKSCKRHCKQVPLTKNGFQNGKNAAVMKNGGRGILKYFSEDQRFSTAVTSSSSQTNKNLICQHFSKGTGNKLFHRRLNNDSNVLKISERRVICRGIKNCVQLELK